ncbi:MAG: malate dehydrogenase [Actinomycetia bacterium]|nr:malate dehydrogenase [Actinomycetes bacterium]
MSEASKKVAIIGSGNVGSNTAFLVALLGVANIALIDVAEGLAEGRALDICQALSILQLDEDVVGGQDFALLKGAEIVIITAGFPRKPGMSRKDLLDKNAAIIKSVCAEIKEKAPDAIVIVVTNPVDAMAHLAWKELGFAHEKVIGMGGMLDSGRFIHFITEATGVARSAVQAVVIGSHSDQMVPLTSFVRVGDEDSDFPVKESVLSGAAEKTKHGGAEIVKLLKTGSAAYGPAAALSTMINSIIDDEKQVFSVCTLAQGEYGLSDIYVNLPVQLGADGAGQIVEIELSEEEEKALELSADSIREMLSELG